MNRDDLQRLSEQRIQEAGALLKAELFPGAFYLAGYAVECALKACIAKKTNQYDFPDKTMVNSSYSHKLADLRRVAGLEKEMEDAVKVDASLGANWRYATTWNEESRYNGSIGAKEAMDLIEAISNADTGVLQWLRKRW